MEPRTKGYGERMKTTITPRLLGINDAATYFGVSRSKIRTMLAGGELPTVRIGGRVLVDRYDLDHIIDTAKAGG